MSIEQLKAIVRQGAEALNSGDLDTLGHLVMGAERWKQGLAEMRAAFPDGRVTIEDLIAENDRVAERWTFQGTHQGEFLGAPATGKQITWTGISIYRISDGKIVERWSLVDLLGLKQQLGLLHDEG